MNETWLIVVICFLAIASGSLGGFCFALQKNLLRTRIEYRTECIERDAAEDKLAATKRHLEETYGLLDQHRELVRHLMDRRFQLECDLEMARRGGSARLALDDQTMALVRLATSNPNEHEKHAAALLVCKRLREKIDEGGGAHRAGT